MLRPFYHPLRACSCAPKTHSKMHKRRSNDPANPLDMSPVHYPQSSSMGMKSTSKSSSLHSPDRRETEARLRISVEPTASQHFTKYLRQEQAAVGVHLLRLALTAVHRAIVAGPLPRFPWPADALHSHPLGVLALHTRRSHFQGPRFVLAPRRHRGLYR